MTPEIKKKLEEMAIRRVEISTKAMLDRQPSFKPFTDCVYDSSMTLAQAAWDLAVQHERERILNHPEILDVVSAINLEAQHQRERWGSSHDAGKTDADWFWLIGYLSGKALHTSSGEIEKKLHRIITIAAAAVNWHGAILRTTDMRPGIITPPLSDSTSRDEEGAE